MLQISVLQTGDAEQARELLASAAVAAGHQSGLQAATRRYGTQGVRPPEGFQQLLVVEGETAHISSVSQTTGAEFLSAEITRRGPVPYVDLVQKEFMSGFDVRAELHGNEVLLHLDQYDAQPLSGDAGNGLHRNIRTSVYGVLGSWLDAGGTLRLDSDPVVSRSYTLRRTNGERTRVLIKVERVP
jgi:hypothetical protein